LAQSIKIGCWAAFWGDTDRALPQLLTVPNVDYLVSDYLSEITMALLARAQIKDPLAGYVPDVLSALKPVLTEIAERGIKVVTNGGALNPAACAEALRALIADAGLSLKVAAVCGDNLLSRVGELVTDTSSDMFTGETIPPKLSSLNAYVGAFPIAQALDAGADIVIAGRCVDAAVVLGPLIHEFGWKTDDYELLSAGALAGHIIECGPQCTGGNHTDWASVPGWDDMGYPLASVAADGSIEVSKPDNTGGLISPASVGEQIVYEIGDPGAYLLPDVTCDWRDVSVAQSGDNRVTIIGAKGTAPTTTYKATCTTTDGFRVITTAMFAGLDAAGRARRAGYATVARATRLMQADGMAAPTEVSVEVIGAGATSADLTLRPADEVVVKVALRHADKAALEIFSKEFATMGIVAQGLTGLFAGRPRVAPVFRIYHLLVPKTEVPLSIDMGGEIISAPVFAGSADAVTQTPQLAEPEVGAIPQGIVVPLRAIAWARSGDKGDRANIGVLARRPEFMGILRDQVTCGRVSAMFGHYLKGPVRRWELGGQNAINILMDAVLGGSGGTSTLRYDPQGKSFAAMLLAMPVTVPAAWDHDGLLGSAGAGR
jgi:hypothetical protein